MITCEVILLLCQSIYFVGQLRRMDGEDGPILGVFYPISLGEFPQTGVMTFGARCEEFSEERVREHIRSIQ